jgi:hypothetical protein
MDFEREHILPQPEIAAAILKALQAAGVTIDDKDEFGETVRLKQKAVTPAPSGESPGPSTG